jgi:polyadenylate-binding protein
MLEENGRSKGFGFVCFLSPEEATKAITVMNGRTIGTQALYVGLAQYKEDRKALLASQNTQQMANKHMQHMETQMLQPGSGKGCFVPTLPQPQRLNGPAQKAQFHATPHRPAQPQFRPNAQSGASGFPNMQTPFQTAPRAPGAQPGTKQKALSARPTTVQQPVSAANIQGRPVAPTVSLSAQGRPTNSKYTANMRNSPQPMPVAHESLEFKAKVEEAMAVLQAHLAQQVKRNKYVSAACIETRQFSVTGP